MENQRLKDFVKQSTKIPAEIKDSILAACSWVQPEIITTSTETTAATLLEPTDYKLMAAIQSAQRSFVITDPSLMDNPIIFASKGFLELTGYPLEEVLGRNCRFLQGSETNRNDIQMLSKGIEAGVDTSACLLNYKRDGTPFYNQIYVAPLRDAEMKIINFVGVQVEIKTEMMHDRMLIQKCTDLKPPNGPKSAAPRSQSVKKASPSSNDVAPFNISEIGDSSKAFNKSGSGTMGTSFTGKLSQPNIVALASGQISSGSGSGSSMSGLARKLSHGNLVSLVHSSSMGGMQEMSSLAMINNANTLLNAERAIHSFQVASPPPSSSNSSSAIEKEKGKSKGRLEIL